MPDPRSQGIILDVAADAASTGARSSDEEIVERLLLADDQ